MANTPQQPEGDWQAALLKAIDVAGGKTSLMRRLNDEGHGISSYTVINQWLLNGVPAKYCPDIELLTGVRCEDLCPSVKWGLVRVARA